jgi:hypothetical protein
MGQAGTHAQTDDERPAVQRAVQSIAKGLEGAAHAHVVHVSCMGRGNICLRDVPCIPCQHAVTPLSLQSISLKEVSGETACCGSGDRRFTGHRLEYGRC